MTSTSGDTTIKFHPDVPSIVCGECGFRTARVASLIDSSGQASGTVIVCLPCRERERARAASAATAAATATARRAAGRPTRYGAVPRQRSVPPAGAPVPYRPARPASSRG